MSAKPNTAALRGYKKIALPDDPDEYQRPSLSTRENETYNEPIPPSITDEPENLLSILPIPGVVKCSVFDEKQNKLILAFQYPDESLDREIRAYRIEPQGFVEEANRFKASLVTSLTLTTAHGLVGCIRQIKTQQCSVVSFTENLNISQTFDTDCVNPKFVWWYVAGYQNTVVIAARASEVLYLYENSSGFCTRQVRLPGLGDVSQMSLESHTLFVGHRSSHRVVVYNITGDTAVPFIEITTAYTGKFAASSRNSSILVTDLVEPNKLTLVNWMSGKVTNVDVKLFVSKPVAVLASNIIAVSLQTENVGVFSA